MIFKNIEKWAWQELRSHHTLNLITIFTNEFQKMCLYNYFYFFQEPVNQHLSMQFQVRAWHTP